MANKSKQKSVDSDSDYDESDFSFGYLNKGKKKAKGDDYKDKESRVGVENAWNYKIPKFAKGDMKHKLVGMTTFTEKYPKYRGPYLKECFPVLKKLFKMYDIKADMDAITESLTVSTTESTWDPYAILIARDIIKLMCRSVPVEKAERLFQEGIVSEVVKIKNLVSDEAVFKKRRSRILGRNNETLISVEKLLDVNLFVQGGTVAIIGSHEHIECAMAFVTKVMKNVHPLHLLKEMDIFVQLKKEDNQTDKDWSLSLPNYTPGKMKKKKKKAKRVVKVYNPLPPAPLESKLDHQLAEGEFFVSNNLKKPKISKEEQKRKSVKIQETKRDKQYVVPKEPVSKKRKLEVDTSSQDVDVAKLKKKIKTQKKMISGQAVSRSITKTDKPVVKKVEKKKSKA